MDEVQKAKLRILTMIVLRVSIYVTIGGYLYNGALALIEAGWNTWIAALGGLTMLILIDMSLHKLLYNRINTYIAKKNKGIQLFKLSEDMPTWKKELIEGMINPKEALFGGEWNPKIKEVINNASKRNQSQNIQQQKQERRIHRNNNGLRWED